MLSKTEKDDLKKVFMSYEVPEIIWELAEFEKEMEAKGYSLDTIWFKINYKSECQVDQPLDMISIIETGSKPYFGLLTDFSTVKDLNEAWVISVSPMESWPRIIAKNIKDFLSLVVKIKILAPFYEIPTDYYRRIENDGYPVPCDFETSEQEWLKEHHDYFYDIDDRKKKADYICKALIDRFELEEIDSAFSYVNQVQEERLQNVSSNTLNGIGVMKRNISSDCSIQLYDYFDMDSNNVLKYLKKANEEELLVFCREVWWHFDLDGEPAMYLIDRLNEIGLKDEGERLKCIAIY